MTKRAKTLIICISLTIILFFVNDNIFCEFRKALDEAQDVNHILKLFSSKDERETGISIIRKIMDRVVVVDSVIKNIKLQEYVISTIDKLASRNEIVEAALNILKESSTTLTSENYEGLYNLVAYSGNKKGVFVVMDYIHSRFEKRQKFDIRFLIFGGKIYIEPILKEIQEDPEFLEIFSCIAEDLDELQLREKYEPFLKYLFIELLKNKNADIRIIAVRGLVALKEREVILLLKSVAKNDPYYYDDEHTWPQKRCYLVREVAIKALKVLEEETFFIVGNTNIEKINNKKYRTTVNLKPEGKKIIRMFDIMVQTENKAKIETLNIKGITLPSMYKEGTNDDKTAIRRTYQGMEPCDIKIEIITNMPPGNITVNLKPLK